jgi:hypothetical protein
MTLSGHEKWNFWYCTRLGVLPEWRSGLVVEQLLFEAVKSRAKSLIPKADTYIWEIASPDIALLNGLRQDIRSGGTIRTRADKDQAIHALRSARRLEVFGWLHALIATTLAKEPLSITSPFERNHHA